MLRKDKKKPQKIENHYFDVLLSWNHVILQRLLVYGLKVANDNNKKYVNVQREIE